MLSTPVVIADLRLAALPKTFKPKRRRKAAAPIIPAKLSTLRLIAETKVAARGDLNPTPRMSIVSMIANGCLAPRHNHHGRESIVELTAIRNVALGLKTNGRRTDPCAA